ncbi:MAG: hypothetical protein MUE51_14820, partial [Thermoleophilia bacterium]|nr:hypothetical protein [Thermoleophilia bacterium]
EREVFVQRLSAAGAEVGPNDARVSDLGPAGDPGFDASGVALASNPRAREYLVAWSGDDDTAPLVDNEREIFTQRLSATGAEVGTDDARVSDMGADGSTASAATDPDVDYNGRADEYLVVWEGDDGTAPLADNEFEVFAQRLSATGAQVGANDFRVSDLGPDGDAAFNASLPSVAYDVRADEHLVAWYGDDSTAPLVDNEFEVFAQRLSATGAEIGGNDLQVSQTAPAGDAAYRAYSPAVAVNSRANEYLIAWDADTGVAPLVDDEYEVWVRRFGAGPVLAAPEAVCATRPPVTPPPAGNPAAVQVSREQLLINQRISQAAVRRANAIQAWLDAGLEGRDLCGGAVGPVELDAGVTVGWGAILATPVAPTPRPVTEAPAGGGDPGGVTLSREQLLINQRISQAAVRRANALKVRLDGGLTGGDIDDGAVGPAILQPTLHILATVAPATPPAASQTVPAPAGGGNPGAVKLSRTQLLINQRISQAAVRRANALRERLLTGISGAGIKDGTVTALDLGAGVGP